jgi:Tol biopolymer transport system component
VVSRADGSEPVVIGEEEEYPWAAWMPDSQHISCLYREGVKIINLETRAVARELPRQGIFQQLFPSPDGRRFCGTGNVGKQAWNIVALDIEKGEATPVHEFQSCTPDWFPDSEWVIYSSRPPDQEAHGGYGATQLWMAKADGSENRLIYGDDAYHVYGGRLSPDGTYVLFTKSIKDGGGSEKEGAPMFLMRMSDTPAVGGDSGELRQKHPEAKDAPVLELYPAWEPDWTYTEVFPE